LNGMNFLILVWLDPKRLSWSWAQQSKLICDWQGRKLNCAADRAAQPPKKNSHRMLSATLHNARTPSFVFFSAFRISPRFFFSLFVWCGYCTLFFRIPYLIKHHPLTPFCPQPPRLLLSITCMRTRRNICPCTRTWTTSGTLHSSRRLSPPMQPYGTCLRRQNMCVVIIIIVIHHHYCCPHDYY